jgi:hypothetical protein
MEDRRKLQRRFMLYYMPVYDVESQHQVGNLVDITPEGIMIVSENPIAEARTIYMRLELTGDVADKTYMEFHARCKWCKQDISPNLYSTGFEILDLRPEDAAIVRRIVETYGFRDNRPGG